MSASTRREVMISTVKNKMNDKTDAMKRRIVDETNSAKTRVENESVYAKERLKQEALIARDKALASAENTAREMLSGLDKLESEIANHYLDGMKYGMAGSDGTKWSNYKKHNANHHKGLAVCCSDVRNPYNKKSRFISLWNKICLAFLLSIIFAAFSDPQSFWKEIFDSVVIACILTPYGLILDALAKCSYCHRKNVCVATARYCGSCALTFFFVLSIINIVGGLVILFCHEDSACSVSQADGMKNFIIYFFLSLVLNQVLPLMTGSLNWIFYTWSGCLCCPQCRCFCNRRFYCWFCCLCNADENYTSDDDSSNNRFLCICPVKYSFCSLLTFFPVRKLLNIYKLAESTYEDDRQLFQEKYPGRISVDDIGCVNQFSEAVLKQGHESAESTTLEQSPLHNESV